MKTIKDLRFEAGFLNKNDKIAILESINKNDFTVSENRTVYHHKTILNINCYGAGMLKVAKSVTGGLNYTYSSYLNYKSI
jgi:hypothetical protein